MTGARSGVAILSEPFLNALATPKGVSLIARAAMLKPRNSPPLFHFHPICSA